MTVQLQADPVHVEPEFVQYEVVDQVATIWFNRPEVKNCVNWGLLTQFGAALERAEVGKHAHSAAVSICPAARREHSAITADARAIGLVK